MRQVIARVGLLCAVMAVTALLTAGIAAPHAEGQPQAALAASAQPGSEADPPVWPFIVGTIAAVAVAAIWSVRRRP